VASLTATLPSLSINERPWPVAGRGFSIYHRQKRAGRPYVQGAKAVRIQCYGKAHLRLLRM
jgi:hypothetical protein